ncbi:MAG: tetratricopeptide repeat protein [Candidatus Stahlbacteria bacterium]|nr:tetratricopeptide repeat protein [Candidatus Stahlbacteria bacterium]
MIDRIQVEREARAYMSRGEWERAISLYRELLETKGADPNIYNLIGDVYAKMDDLPDAIPEYCSAIELYETEGLFENGIAVCKKLLRLSPAMGDIYFELAVFYAEIGLLNEAKDALMNYLEHSKDKKIIEKNSQRYKKLIILLSSDDRLKPIIQTVYTKIGQKEKELNVILGIAEPEPEPEPEELPELIEPAEPLTSNEIIEKSTAQIPKIEKTTKISQSSQEPVFKKEDFIGSEKSSTTSKLSPKQQREKEIADILLDNPSVATAQKPSIEHTPKSQPVPPAQEEVVENKEELSSCNESEVQIFLHTIEEIKATDVSKIQKDHYETGLQYKDLGFYDAAIKEFQLSTTGGPNRLKALKEVGYCFLEKNQPQIAVNAFHRAIEEGGKNSEDYIALKYGIGKAYELLGDKKKAIEVLEEVYLLDIHYLDVKERLLQLKGI